MPDNLNRIAELWDEIFQHLQSSEEESLEQFIAEGNNADHHVLSKATELDHLIKSMEV